MADANSTLEIVWNDDSTLGVVIVPLFHRVRSRNFVYTATEVAMAATKARTLIEKNRYREVGCFTTQCQMTGESGSVLGHELRPYLFISVERIEQDI